ncbi:MAG: phosphoribosyltransferase [Geminicoccaceae bacterium]
MTDLNALFASKIFTDRTDAGQQLALALQRFKAARPVVLALPRGGVPVAYEVAKALDAPLDLVLVRKIGTPWQPELAIAAVVDGSRPETVVNRDIVNKLNIPPSYIEERATAELEEVERRRQLYLADRPRIDIAGRTTIVIDDGIATGATMEAALHATRRAGPERLILAVPVAPPETIERLRAEVDEIVCLECPKLFGAIGLFYREFHQLSDDEVVNLLQRVKSEKQAPDEASNPEGWNADDPR